MLGSHFPGPHALSLELVGLCDFPFSSDGPGTGLSREVATTLSTWKGVLCVCQIVFNRRMLYLGVRGKQVQVPLAGLWAGVLPPEAGFYVFQASLQPLMMSLMTELLILSCFHISSAGLMGATTALS